MAMKYRNIDVLCVSSEFRALNRGIKHSVTVLTMITVLNTGTDYERPQGLF